MIGTRIASLGEKNHYAFYAAFFRLFICFHLLKDIILSWSYINLLYNAFLFFYILFICLFFFGIGKYFTALVLFILYEIQQRLGFIVLNGGDNLLKFILLYMVFIDSYQFFSITKLKIRNATLKYVRTFVSNVAGFSICLHLCLAYFLSAIHKVHADVWFNGVATYYTLSLERFRGTQWNLLFAKNGYFVTIATYFTILVELYYPVLIWFKRTKKAISICAILLHIGIYVFMMIYDFQVVFIMAQGFFFSNIQWVCLINRWRRKWKNIAIKMKTRYENRKNSTSAI